jgi:hypothetical protein
MPAKKKVPVPGTWTESAPAPELFEAVQLLDTYLTQRAVIAELTKESEELRDRLVGLLYPDGVALPGGGLRAPVRFANVGDVNPMAGRIQTRIDRSKLIAAGVDPVTIDRCTVVTKGADFVRITAEDAADTPEEQ